MSRLHAAALATMLLLPATLHAQPQDCGSIIARDPQLSRAIQALQRTGILENLRGLGPVTVFAVTDQGIARQPEDLAQMLFPIAGGSLGGPDIDPVLAPAVVNAHIVDGRIGADQLRPGMSLRSRSGGTIEVVAEQGGQLALRPGPGGFSVGARPADAHIVQPDIGCTNGVVHKIDHVLVR